MSCYNIFMKYYEIEQISNTGLARAIYTTADNPDWKFGKKPALNNFRKLASQFNITADDFTMTNHAHTSEVRALTRENGGELVTRPLGGGSPIFYYDGILTDEPGLMLCTVEADCVPIYMLDPVNKAVAMIHSGWRGTVGKISAKAVMAMEENYGTDPADLIIHIGPCICEKCYDVGAELIDKFAVAFGENAASAFFTPRNTGNMKFNLDMKKAVRHTLLEAGADPKKITAENRCTLEDEELCSWRRQNPVKTSMLTAIILNR